MRGERRKIVENNCKIICKGKREKVDYEQRYNLLWIDNEYFLTCLLLEKMNNDEKQEIYFCETFIATYIES